MMDLERVVPGRGMLHRQVHLACGPGSRFRELGHSFGDWVEYGTAAAEPSVAEVERHLAGYLLAASRAGRWWGIVAGLVAGSGAGLFLALALWLALAVAR
jgi:hypothetical protein